uniref:Protein TIC 214 n=1 Tax=Spatholobus pulcher TaxID=1341721 RepID=A0A6M8PYL2_9FABA|nr:Ycf1 [Spatholobus pulcher]QKI32369.1 Ycf1 [Spatholobus pulcher]
MIFQSFILDNLVFLCMKIINSIVVVGLYYGFLTTFSIGPSYLFLLRARLVEEGTEKKISATTGFITGQLIMFISIYYAPLHLALGRPHTITVIALPYLLFQFFANNHKNFLNYGYKNTNSIRNFSIQRIFFQNLIFQLLNPLFLPSSILIRLVNIYLFRCNNKLLFLTSSFVGWIIGHTFLMKCIEFILVCIQQNNSIKSSVPIQSNKYIMSEFRNSIFKIFLFFLFVTCLYYLGRIPPPFFNKKLSETQERNEIYKKEKIDVKRNLQRVRSKQKQKRSKNKDLFPYIFSKKEKNLYKIDEEKNSLGFVQKPLVNILFNYKRWNRPFRYIKNNRFENIVKNEISEFFFHTCQSDGKERISFMYPPSLSTFHKMMETKIDLFTRDQFSYDELSNYWTYTNEEKRKKLSNEFLNRAKVTDKEFLSLDILENRIRLCNDETKTKYLTKIYDPFFNGPLRGRIKFFFSPSIQDEKTYKKNNILINKIHGILLYNNIYKNNNSNYPELEEKINTFDRKSLVTTFFFFNLISKFSKKSISSLSFEAIYLFPEHEQVEFNSEDEEEKKLIIQILFDAIRTDWNDKTIVSRNRTQFIRINEISKKVPRWSYKFIDELEQLEGKNQAENYQIRSRKGKRVVILTKSKFLKKDDTYNDTGDTDNTEKKKNELALIRYSQQSDFRRDIIKGSIRAQRRKTVTWKFFQKSVHSPLFLDKIEKPLFFSFDSFKSMKIFFMLKNWMRKKTEFQISDYTEEKTKENSKKEEEKKKENEEKKRIEIAEAWDNIIFAQVIRSVLLITQSILRKYIILPSLIIIKNIVRILFFQFPEWSEDFRDWKREMYIKCTYNGVQLSETEFPQKWLTDGIQIKILFPFRLKSWHKSKLRSNEKKKDQMKKKNFCFLTIWGTEVELPFSGSPKNRFSFFYPIFKELKKKTKQFQFFIFLVLKVLSEKLKLFLNILKEKAKWIIKSILKSILFLTKKIKQFSKFLFIKLKLKKIDELSESKKDSTIYKNSPTISEATIPIQSINSANCSLTKKKIKDLNDKRKAVIKKIEKMKKEEKKRGLVILDTNIHSNKTTYDSKRIEFEKKNLQILQRRRNARLTRQSHSFFKFCIKRIPMDIFLYIIYIPRINTQLFLESTNKILNKFIYNNEANTERTDKTNQSIIRFISIIHKYFNTRNTNSQNSCDVSFLSQAYVFLNLLQTRIINIYKLKSVFQYHGIFFFLKNEIKDSFFGVQGIFHSKLKHKNPPNSVINQWTNWLKDHYYQYDLSQSRWSKLVPQKWRNRITEYRVARNKDLTKWDSYEKSRLILYKEQQVDALKKKKKKIRKQYRYDLLSYNFVNYADNKDSYIYGYRCLFQANKNQVISSNYNTHKKELFDIIDNIFIKNYIAKDAIIDMEKNLDRKYLDWTGINIEILNRSISNTEFWFFSKFVIFYNAYRSNPWVIPIKLLFLHFNVNQNVSENKNNITRKKKIIDIFRPSKKKKSLELELETRNRAKAEYADRINLESSLSNQEKDIEKDYVGLGSEKNGKGIKKKKDKNKMEAELNFLLRNFLTLHLNWKNFLGQRIFQNVKVYCLLIRLKNLREITIASIQRGELGLDIMMIQNQKNFTLPGLRKNKKFMKKEIFVIEPVRLSRKNNKQFIMYQTMGLSLIHKNKRKIYQKYPEKSHVNKKNFDKYIKITRDQKITEKKEKKNYDLLVPENILSARRRRELRILICLNPSNRNSMHRNTIFYNENKVHNCFQVLTKKRKRFKEEKKKLMNFQIFLWPNYRLEDLACINRYWFNTHNGSRFSIVRIHMYPRLKIR